MELPRKKEKFENIFWETEGRLSRLIQLDAVLILREVQYVAVEERFLVADRA